MFWNASRGCGLAVLPDDERGGADAGAVDDAVQAAELDRRVDGRLDARLVAHVRLDEAADLLAPAEVGDDDVAAGVREQPRRRGAEAGAAAGDEERAAGDLHG